MIPEGGGEGFGISSITDSNSNNYANVPVSNNYYRQLFHADQAVTANGLHGTVARDNLNGICLLEFYDIVGAAASLLDTSATCPAPSVNYGCGACSNMGTLCSANQGIADAPDITPSTSNGLVLEAVNLGTGPVSDSINATFDFV
jgi:hypothetical protein